MTFVLDVNVLKHSGEASNTPASVVNTAFTASKPF